MKKNDKSFLELSKYNLISKIEDGEIPSGMFLDILKKWGGDREVVISVLEKSAENVSEISDELKADKEVMFIAMREDPIYMVYASKELKDDKEFVLQAIEAGCCSMHQISERLSNDRELAMRCVEINGLDLWALNEKFKDDREIVAAAIKHNVDGLRYASERLQNEMEFLLLLRGSSFLKGKWYEEKMKVLEILEEEAWMQENRPQCSPMVRPKKF